MLLEEKSPLTAEEIESQAAIELPERDTLLVTVVLTISGNRVTITVRDIDVAAQVCAAILAVDTNVTCEIRQP